MRLVMASIVLSIIAVSGTVMVFLGLYLFGIIGG